MFADCRKDSRWTKKADDNTGFETKSMICVPLVAEDLVFGCIQLEETAPAGKIYISRTVADALGKRAEVVLVEKTDLIEMLSLEHLE